MKQNNIDGETLLEFVIKKGTSYFIGKTFKFYVDPKLNPDLCILCPHPEEVRDLKNGDIVDLSVIDFCIHSSQEIDSGIICYKVDSGKRGSCWISKLRLVAEEIKENNKKPCSCEINTLMAYGCKCGGI